ncbi:MOSC domain-containing protein [Belliella kenyensis]|uniref:MOSC domain-containing protein n=1 Tax=Belliella kenyensis TaxID=1472724 RepID=A0ABV8EFZ4_9BACT|nr:MOSC N-terminal beta barrel domain-containing protein [Belliella kenyensis]MCH7401050.1 MOSC domain-containing protein [Belliella kenyensis]MDN3604048.1 MOSC domain-containing protein [Belliella kenyensis]
MILKDIYIYPIKSLGGIRLAKATLEERGIQLDRRWMLVDENGLFLSQRTFPDMALIHVELSGNEFVINNKKTKQSTLIVPFEEVTEELIWVQIWEDKVQAQIVSKEVSLWFSEALDKKCMLVKMPDNVERKVSSKYAVNSESVSFADGMPYLLIGQSSLDDLNNKLSKPVLMDRFRPNFVFEGGDAFVEDSLKTIKIGSSIFQIVKPCARCVMTTIDQETGKKGKEPLKTLASYRTINNKVMFGQNMVLIEGGEVKVGDIIERV